ncbi:MAG: Gfo/Idh/MocA family oxidoreductase [Opitutaceae bacterium]|nr:Gfo/Idh/MocA family oxidoreductase [Opitutaceae bacterium]
MTSPIPPLRVGLIGCGNISDAYFEGLRPFSTLASLTLCADVVHERALAKASQHRIRAANSLDELLSSKEIDVVLVLTPPRSHASLCLQALQAGKHVYVEKPLATSYAEGVEVVREARKRNLTLGCAPDTVLGDGIQTFRHALDSGAIGAPVACVANMLCRGHEHWHPSPDFYYQEGGGPLFDMGPYYLTTLVSLFGPCRSVCAMAKTSFAERTATSAPCKGKTITVRVPTHYSASLGFHNGVIASLIMSFDTYSHSLPWLEVYGSDGSLLGPDPNRFDGSVKVARLREAWSDHPSLNLGLGGRGLGVAEMCLSLRKGARHASGDVALHVLEIMDAINRSASTGTTQLLESSSDRPPPVSRELRDLRRLSD